MEARLEQTGAGLVPTGGGRLVVNAHDALRVHSEGAHRDLRVRGTTVLPGYRPAPDRDGWLP